MHVVGALKKMLDPCYITVCSTIIYDVEQLTFWIPKICIILYIYIYIYIYILYVVVAIWKR